MPTEEELQNMSPEELAEFQKQNCIFCQISSGKIPAKKVYEDDKSIAVLDINPATKGHMLLMPKDHFAVLMQAPEDIIEHLFLVAKGLSQAALKGLECKGTTIFVANGVAAGQRAPHVMVHVIPRYEKDNLNMIIPKRKISGDDMKSMRDTLRKALGSDVKDAEIVEKTQEPEQQEQPAEEEPAPEESQNEEVSKSEKPKKKKKKKKKAKKKEEGYTEEFDLDAVGSLFG